MAGKTAHARIDVLEAGFKTLATTLVEIRDEIRRDRTAMVDEFRSIRAETLSFRPFPWREVSYAVGITSMLLTGALTGLNFWYSAKASGTEQAVESVQQQLRDQSPLVLKYRVDEIERLLREASPKK